MISFPLVPPSVPLFCSSETSVRTSQVYTHENYVSWRKSWVLFVFGSGWFGTMRCPGQLVRLEQDLQGERPWENHGKADTNPGGCGFGLSAGQAVSLETYPLWLWGYLVQYNLCFLNLWRWDYILEWWKIHPSVGKPSSHPFKNPASLSSVWEEMVWKTSKVMRFQLAFEGSIVESRHRD